MADLDINKIVYNLKNKNAQTQLSEYDKMSDKLLNENKHLNFVQRALTQNDENALRTEDNKSHYMSYMTDDNGNHLIVPFVVQKKGENKLTEFKTPRQAMDYAKKNR